jgi:diaminohydroxyphosphoribosylaminopyrimidine deaminase/5-amino-6-(5-phosphoribosylamino)uracil reductase
MVGAVIVRDGREIASAWHRRFGGPHAEVAALAAARQARADCRGATLYVTLEPCCHHGKTPPCTEALIEAGIARVVAAMVDPDEHVSGRGIRRLREAGIEVEVGLCRAEALRLLAPYVKLRTAGRPWVICKWAQTADGWLSLPAGAGRWISGEPARQRAHELRSYCDGVCVGIGTLLADDPLLTNRSGSGRQPVRLVLDSRLRTPPDCRMIRTAGEGAAAVVATTAQAAAERPERAQALRRAGAEVLELAASADGVDFAGLLDELGRRQWTRLLVEGGAALLRHVIDSRLADELWVFVAPRRLGAAEKLPRLDIAELRRRLRLEQPQEESVGPDRLLRLRLA